MNPPSLICADLPFAIEAANAKPCVDVETSHSFAGQDRNATNSLLPKVAG